jgi:hypothetical protein
MAVTVLDASAAISGPWREHPGLSYLLGPLKITADCWKRLYAPVGASPKKYYLPKGEREPESAYRKRLKDARQPDFGASRRGWTGDHLVLSQPHEYNRPSGSADADHSQCDQHPHAG